MVKLTFNSPSGDLTGLLFHNVDCNFGSLMPGYCKTVCVWRDVVIASSPSTHFMISFVCNRVRHKDSISSAMTAM